MKFTHEGTEYLIEFERQHKTFIVYDPIMQADKEVPSKWPYTIVRILELIPGPIVTYKTYREATVGAWHREPTFSLEKGRLRALALVTRTLPKTMKPLLWKTYMQRATSKVPKV